MNSSGSSSSSSTSRAFSVSPIDAANIQRRLSVGSQLSARIVEAHGQGKYTVGFAGLRMIAESPLELAVGQRVLVQVASLDPKIHLRVVDAKGRESFNNMVRQMAGDLPESTIRDLINELMDRGLPLDQGTLKKAIAALKQGLSPRAAAKFVAGNIPLSDSLAARAEASNGSVARALERLVELLKSSARDGEAARIQNGLTFNGNLKELLARHPLKMERRLLGENPSLENGGVKALLIELSELAARAGGMKTDAEIARAARDLLEALDGRYLFGDPEPEIPFVVEDEGFRDGGITAERRPDRSQVRIRLDTSNLGHVAGVIDSHNDRIGIALGVPKPEAREAMIAAVPELVASLKALGFEMDSITVDVVRPKDAAAAAERGLGFDVRA